MQRTNGDGHIDNMFVEEDVNIGRKPTQITAVWMNAVQEELATAIEGSGLSLNSNDNSQLLKVLQNISGYMIGEIAMFSTPNAPTNFLKCNGAAISRAIYSYLFDKLVTSQGFTSQAFTVSIASPAVFTKANHNFVGGERLRLSTTGALPTGLNTTTDYFVEPIDINTFCVSTLVSGGLRVNTSGTQSGTHSFLQSLYGLGDGSTTFNLPDFRGLFLRGMDDGAGIDAAHYLGSKQRGTILPIDTNLGTTSSVWSLSTNQLGSIALSRNGHSVDAVTDNNQYASIGIYSASASQSTPSALSTAIATDGGLGIGVARPVNASLNFAIRYK